ncbi:MAG TPA: RraA family protein [Nocardioidaceae bacterium]|nr:RraA family protein [Nocardioidaceae bacterium]
MPVNTVSRPLSTVELDALVGTIRSALVSDVLDGMGLRDQCLAPGLLPVDGELTMVGYAYNTMARLVDAVPDVPYIGLLDALDAVATDDVWVVSSSSDAALWGELTSTSVRARGVRGTVCDGYMRDLRMVRDLGFPVFSRGTSPRDANGRIEIERYSGVIEVAGVPIANGDLVVGDDDGVVVVPSTLILEVVSAALEKASAESEFRAAVAQGMKPSDAYRQFGVL